MYTLIAVSAALPAQLQTWLSHSMAVINHVCVTFQWAKPKTLEATTCMTAGSDGKAYIVHIYMCMTHNAQHIYKVLYMYILKGIVLFCLHYNSVLKSNQTYDTASEDECRSARRLKETWIMGAGLYAQPLRPESRKAIARVLFIPVRSPLLRESLLVSIFALRLLICLNSARCLA